MVLCSPEMDSASLATRAVLITPSRLTGMASPSILMLKVFSVAGCTA